MDKKRLAERTIRSYSKLISSKKGLEEGIISTISLLLAFYLQDNGVDISALVLTPIIAFMIKGLKDIYKHYIQPKIYLWFRKIS